MIQRFGGGLNLNVHFHTLVLDGVYAQSGGALVFHGAPPPSDREVGRVVVTVRRRVLRLLARRGFAPDVEAAIHSSRNHRCWPASRARPC